MKFGFELEAFALSIIDNTPMLVPQSLPMDECGWLIEVRSEPHADIKKAIYLLRAERDKVIEQSTVAGVSPAFYPLFEIPRDLKVQAARRDGKGRLSYQNIYGFETHRNSTKLQTASMHISFTNERNFVYDSKDRTSVSFRYPGFVDHAKLIVGLDKAFKDEIKTAKRNPGFYEVKGDGRIEYRSLPNNVSLDKVEMVLYDLTKD